MQKRKHVIYNIVLLTFAVFAVIISVIGIGGYPILFVHWKPLSPILHALIRIASSLILFLIHFYYSRRSTYRTIPTLIMSFAYYLLYITFISMFFTDKNQLWDLGINIPILEMINGTFFKIASSSALTAAILAVLGESAKDFWFENFRKSDDYSKAFQRFRRLRFNLLMHRDTKWFWSNIIIFRFLIYLLIWIPCLFFVFYLKEGNALVFFQMVLYLSLVSMTLGVVSHWSGSNEGLIRAQAAYLRGNVIRLRKQLRNYECYDNRSIPTAYSDFCQVLAAQYNSQAEIRSVEKYVYEMPKIIEEIANNQDIPCKLHVGADFLLAFYDIINIYIKKNEAISSEEKLLSELVFAKHIQILVSQKPVNLGDDFKKMTLAQVLHLGFYSLFNADGQQVLWQFITTSIAVSLPDIERLMHLDVLRWLATQNTSEKCCPFNWICNNNSVIEMGDLLVEFPFIAKKCLETRASNNGAQLVLDETAYRPIVEAYYWHIFSANLNILEFSEIKQLSDRILGKLQNASKTNKSIPCIDTNYLKRILPIGDVKYQANPRDSILLSRKQIDALVECNVPAQRYTISLSDFFTCTIPLWKNGLQKAKKETLWRCINRNEANRFRQENCCMNESELCFSLANILFGKVEN